MSGDREALRVAAQAVVEHYEVWKQADSEVEWWPVIDRLRAALAATEAEGIDSLVLAMAMDLVSDEDARVGVVGRGRKSDRVIAEYTRIRAGRLRDARSTPEEESGG